MIVAITGTPTTGKSSAAEKLAEITGWKLIPLNQLAEEKDLYRGYDKERNCKIIDMETLAEHIMEMSGNNIIVESHYAHEMPADLVIVLRTNPAEMRKRAEKREWNEEKTEENVQAEIMEVCKSESLEQGKVTREIDTTGKTAERAASEAAHIMEKEGMFVMNDLRIPESMREELRKPYGKLYRNLKDAKKHIHGTVISVGDQVGYGLNISGPKPSVTIMDGKIRRKPSGREIEVDGRTIDCRNGTGYITNDLWMRTHEAIASGDTVKVMVDGEEDMAALAAMMLAPDGLSIVYGLFDSGVCVVRSGRETRKTARDLLSKIAGSQ